MSDHADKIKRIVKENKCSNNEAERILKFERLEFLIDELDDGDEKEILKGLFGLIEGEWCEKIW